MLSVADLAGLPIPRWAHATPDQLRYWAGRDLVPSDLPLTGPLVEDSSQLVEVVALGQAVALVPASLAECHQRADVVYRPVHDASPYVIAIAWAAGARNRLLADFVRVASERPVQYWRRRVDPAERPPEPDRAGPELLTGPR